jgi:hypothetical protein
VRGIFLMMPWARSRRSWRLILADSRRWSAGGCVADVVDFGLRAEPPLWGRESALPFSLREI